MDHTEGDGQGVRVPVSPVTLPRVVVVEDDPDSLVLFGKVMGRVPADALPVATAATARHAARTLGRFEILLVDQRLPDGDGIELARELRPTCGCRVIVVSGDPVPRTGPPAGFDVWLTKPVNVGILLEQVRRLITPNPFQNLQAS